jgi:hypothetical protein
MATLRRKNGIRTVCSGKIGGHTTGREILWSALKQRNVEFGVLRIHNKTTGTEGDIGIAKGIYIVGADLSSRKEKGWEAVRLLLSAQDGTFQYLDFGEQFPHYLDQSIKIRLTDIISAWPALPDRAEQIMSGRNSLNRIRNYEPQKQSGGETAILDRNVLSELQAWDARNLHLRAAAFWSTFAVLSCLAAVLAYFN